MGDKLLTPYFESENVTLYLGDAREVCATLPSNSAQLVLTDPPYGTLDGRGKVQKIGKSHVAFNAGEWDTELPLAWIDIAMPLLEPGGWFCVFTDNTAVGEVWQAIETAGGHGKQTFAWIKNNVPPTPRRNFCSAVESAVLATKGPVRKWNGGGKSPNYFIEPICGGDERTAHPTQKPEAVMEYLLRRMSDVDDVVLDPFCGSGTTGVVALRWGRKFIGVDSSESYLRDIALPRLQQAERLYDAPLLRANKQTLLFNEAKT